MAFLFLVVYLVFMVSGVYYSVQEYYRGFGRISYWICAVCAIVPFIPVLNIGWTVFGYRKYGF